MVSQLNDPDLLEVTIPAIGFLGMQEPIHLQFYKEYLKLAVRVVVVWCTFLIFRPRIAKAWNVMFGDNDEQKRKEIEERIAFLEAKRDIKAGLVGPPKKSVAVVSGSSGSTTASPAEKGAAKRRKA